MKDYTEIFSKAIELSSGYNIKNIAKIINSTDDEWCTYLWYDLCKKTADNKMGDNYGYLSVEYPVAIIKENCPDIIKRILAENNILLTEFEEPMCCNEDIFRKYINRRVIDESAFLNGDFSFDDERFDFILDRIETGMPCYVDASDFMFDDIHTRW